MRKPIYILCLTITIVLLCVLAYGMLWGRWQQSVISVVGIFAFIMAGVTVFTQHMR